jgi:hypothetical protein
VQRRESLRFFNRIPVTCSTLRSALFLQCVAVVTTKHSAERLWCSNDAYTLYMRWWAVISVILLAITATAAATTTPNSRASLQRQQHAARQADRDDRHEEGEICWDECYAGTDVFTVFSNFCRAVIVAVRQGVLR